MLYLAEKSHREVTLSTFGFKTGQPTSKDDARVSFIMVYSGSSYSLSDT